MINFKFTQLRCNRKASHQCATSKLNKNHNNQYSADDVVEENVATNLVGFQLSALSEFLLARRVIANIRFFT